MEKKALRAPEFAEIALLAAIFAAAAFLMRTTAAKVGELSGGQGIIDLTFAISPQRISAALSRYNDVSASFYRKVFLTIDAIYALCYSSFYRAAVKKVCAGKKYRAARLAPAIPLAGCAADLLENTAMFVMLSGYSPFALRAAFTAFNVIKFVCVYSSFAIVLGGIICLIKKRLS